MYETKKCVFNFQQFETIRCFNGSTFNSKITQGETDEKWSNVSTLFYSLIVKLDQNPK